MDVIETEIPDVKRIVLKRFGDTRGWFSETFRADTMARAEGLSSVSDGSLDAILGAVRDELAWFWAIAAVGAALDGQTMSGLDELVTVLPQGASLAALSGLRPAPSSLFNAPIGPHRRFTWVRGDLSQFKAVKNALGGTVNDVVLAAVAGGLRHFLEARGEPVDGLTLKAFVPVSVRDESQRGTLGRLGTMTL